MAEPFEVYLQRSRLRFQRGQTVTVAQLRGIYRAASRDVTAEIRRLLPTQPSARHMNAVQGMLRERSTTLKREIMNATMQGIDISVDAAVAAAEAIAHDTLGTAFDHAGIKAMFHTVNERAVLAFATRSMGDGLRLSDRVWRIGDQYRGEIARSLESGIARGQSVAKLAADLQKHLDPDRLTPHGSSVRRRLHLSRSIDYRAMRLARTEMGLAYKEGTVLGHRATPSYRGVQWLLSDSHPIADECDALAYGGDLGEGIYSPGNEPQQPHPQCLCTLAPAHEETAAFEERLHSWLDEPTSQPDLERWYQTQAAPFFQGGRPTLPGKSMNPTISPVRRPAPVPVKAKAVARPVQRVARTRTRTQTQLRSAVTQPTKAKAKAQGTKAAVEVKNTVAVLDDAPEIARIREATARYADALAAHESNLSLSPQVLKQIGRKAEAEKAVLEAIDDVGAKVLDAIDARIGPMRAAEIAQREQVVAITQQKSDALRKFVHAKIKGNMDEAAQHKALADKLDIRFSKEFDKLTTLTNRLQSARPAAMREVLGEVRTMGGKLKAHVSGAEAPKLQRMLDELDDVFPRDWVDASDNYVGADLNLKHEMLGPGTGAQHNGVSGTITMNDMYAGEWKNSLLHELGHRMQTVVGNPSQSIFGAHKEETLFMRIEAAFRRSRRLPGEQIRYNPAYDQHNWIEDSWPDDYFGVLNSSGRGETFTRGLEMLVNDKWGGWSTQNESLVRWMLGMLAAV